eukprot:32069_1
MELKASKVISALDFLQNLSQNPLQSVSSKNRSILDEIRKSYFTKNVKSTTGKKRKQSPSKSIGPKPKRQRTLRNRHNNNNNNNNMNNNNININSIDITNISEEEEEMETDIEEEEIETDTSSLDNGLTLIEDSANNRNINGDSPSHFTYFNESNGIFIANKGSLSPIWSRGEPRHNNLDNYLQSIGKIFYHPIEAMEQSININNINNNNNNN